jgi:hypothetical protein
MPKRQETTERAERIKDNAVSTLRQLLEILESLPASEVAQLFNLNIARFVLSPKACQEQGVADGVSTHWTIGVGRWEDTETGEFWEVHTSKSMREAMANPVTKLKIV